jgi:hypothetical protein
MATAEEREERGVLLLGKSQTPNNFLFIKHEEKVTHWNLDI